ncbi:MAG: PH domain-containing protein [Thaumarchaeota archaeon]|nr:PH domain-containing protein [Nitrososphaerota archaeon]
MACGRTDGGRKDKGYGGDFPLDEKLNKRIKDRLDPGERVVISIRQSRFLAGGSPVTPNAIFLTPRRVIIRNPTRLGLGEQVEGFSYDDITNVRLERGMMSSSIVLTIPGQTEMSNIERNTNSAAYNPWGRDTPGTIDALPRDKAEAAYRYIRERIREAKKKRQEVRVADGKESAEERQDPLHTLKMRCLVR